MKNTGWIIFHSFLAGCQFAALLFNLRLTREVPALWCLGFLALSVLFVVLNLTVLQKDRT